MVRGIWCMAWCMAWCMTHQLRLNSADLRMVSYSSSQYHVLDEASEAGIDSQKRQARFFCVQWNAVAGTEHMFPVHQALDIPKEHAAIQDRPQGFSIVIPLLDSSSLINASATVSLKPHLGGHTPQTEDRTVGQDIQSTCRTEFWWGAFVRVKSLNNAALDWRCLAPFTVSQASPHTTTHRSSHARQQDDPCSQHLGAFSLVRMHCALHHAHGILRLGPQILGKNRIRKDLN